MSTPIESRARPVDADSARSDDRSGGGDLPLVSIGMPAYNSGHFIRQSLEALLTQDYENIELIVSDDGSTDETPEVCAGFARADPRIVMVDGAHRGERQNFNTVLRLARGKYFMWAADHDLWDASYVSTCVAALEEHPGAVLAYARSALIDTEGRVLSEMDDALGITQKRPIDRYRSLIRRLENCNAIYGLMRCELLKVTGGYGPYPAPDHLVLAKMALHGTFVQVPKTLYFRRQTRPLETPEDQRRRQPFDLDPVEASKWLSRPERDYFRTLRDAHLAAVRAAPISVGDKVLGLTATVACFGQRFGVRSRVWIGTRKILHRVRAALRRLRSAIADAAGRLPGGRDRATGLTLPPVELRAGGHHFRRDKDFVRSAAREVELLVRLAGLAPTSRVLDVGCGAGRLAYGLIARYGGAIAYDGLDVMEAPIDWCRRRISPAYPGYRFTRVDLRNERYNPAGVEDATVSPLPFPANQFDLIYAYSVLSHMRARDIEAYLHEFERLMASSGRIVVTAFIEEGVEDEAVNPPHYGPMIWSGDLHCVRFSRSYFETALRRAGLELLHFEYGLETDGQSRVILGRATAR